MITDYSYSTTQTTHGKHVDLIKEGRFGPNTTSLTQPYFNEVPVPGQKSEQSCICVLWVSILPLYIF